MTTTTSLAGGAPAGSAAIQPCIDLEYRPDGTILAGCPIPLPPSFKTLPALFEATARTYPDRVFMRQRVAPGGPWQAVSYAEALQRVHAIGQWFVDNGAAAGDVVAIISGQSISHALVMLGAQFAGLAVAPLSPAYALLSTDFIKLRNCLDQCAARFVFADDGVSYEKAIGALRVHNTALHIIVDRNAGDVADTPLTALKATPLKALEATPVTPRLHEVLATIEPEHLARIMFTAGSTGAPKATPQTHRLLATTVAQVEALKLLEFDGELIQHLEAMPFSHIMAGNFNFNNVLRVGGTINLDDGKPTPEHFHHTIANLREISPHFFITVPLGYAMLCDAMEKDAALRDSFFRNMRYIGFGGAVLPDPVAQRLRALAVQSLGRTIPIFSFYGATEYLFGALQYWDCPRMDVIGLPPPALTWKLVPFEDKFELRVDGPTLMAKTGYLGGEVDPETLFDEEGFYRTGDLVRWLDPNDPLQGLVYCSRLAEEFKLSTGTWVSVAPLRAAVLSACDPWVREAVICGLNREWVGLLLWLNEDKARELVDDAARTLTSAQLAAHPAVVDVLHRCLADHNATATGSSLRIGRAMIMAAPLLEHEVSAKATANQRLVRTERQADVDRLYDDAPAAQIVDLRKR